MRAELAWRTMGDYVADGMVRMGVGKDHAEPWLADWRFIVEALVGGDRPVDECVLDLVRMLTLARELCAALREVS